MNISISAKLHYLALNPLKGIQTLGCIVTELPCQINPLFLGYDDVVKILSIHNQISYDLCLSTWLFAVGDKWNTNVSYVANTKVNNVAKRTKSYANSMQLLNNVLFNANKKVENLSYGKLMQKSCSQRKIKIFKIMRNIQGQVFDAIVSYKRRINMHLTKQCWNGGA